MTIPAIFCKHVLPSHHCGCRYFLSYFLSYLRMMDDQNISRSRLAVFSCSVINRALDLIMVYVKISLGLVTFEILLCLDTWEHEAQWIDRWMQDIAPLLCPIPFHVWWNKICLNQDQNILGSIPTAGDVLVICRSVGQTSNSNTTLAYPAVMSICWTKIVPEWLQLLVLIYMTCVLYFPRGYEIAQVVCVLDHGRWWWVPLPSRIFCCVITVGVLLISCLTYCVIDDRKHIYSGYLMTLCRISTNSFFNVFCRVIKCY